MKKLMFATALVASAAAFATNGNALNAISFEGYTVDTGVGSGTGDIPEGGGATGTAYFWFDGDTDGSLVKEFGGENVAKPSIRRPYYFQGETAAKYLELSTEGGILWRSINESSANGLGTPQAIAATGTYLDTLVQFTPTEDGGAPTLGTDDKLAIWLNVDSSGASPVTNLQVKANLYDFGEAPSATATTFTLAAATGTKEIVAGEWYRLTIKAIPNVMNTDENGIITAFEIYIDGVQMRATTAQFTSAMANMLSGMSAVSEDAAAAIAANKLFPSLAEMGGTGSTPSLEGIGFKGSGALDDIVWTEENPFANQALEFTLTWPDGVTPVSYTIGNGEAVAIASGSTSPFSVPGLTGGETVAFTFMNADGVTKTMSVSATDHGDIDASTATYTWADYLGDAVNGAYTIDDADDLGMLRKGVAAGLATVGETFNQTANIDMSSAGPFAGIGTYNANLNNGVAFCGTYDGQGFTISNVDFTQRNYGGVFNQVKGGTIKNLTVDTITCSTFSSSANDGEWGCSIIGNVGLGSTVQGLTAMGDFGTTAIPCSHNVAGIAIRVCGGASNVVNGVTMLETLVKDCTNNATLHGFYTKAGGITALTQDQNSVPNDYVLFDGCVNNSNIAMVEATGSTLSKIGRDGLSGILGYVADGTKIKDCVNNGTLTSALTTAKIGGIVGWAQGRFLDDLGGNKNPAAAKMIGDPAGSTISGFKYATVDNGVATTLVPPYTLAKNTTYLLEGQIAAAAAPVFTLAAAGDWIEFDTALGYTNVVGMVAGEGVTSETTGTVTKYWIPSAGGDDYVVVIEGSDVVITPTAEDFATVAEYLPQGVTTSDVAVVNQLLAAPIEGTTIPNWQALFLGVEPTTNGLEQVAIKSISFNSEGKVEVVMADGVTLKTGRGVDIKLILKGSDDLTTWTTLQTATNTKEFTPVTRGLGETKKFYKVVVEFAGSSAQN